MLLLRAMFALLMRDNPTSLQSHCRKRLHWQWLCNNLKVNLISPLIASFHLRTSDAHILERFQSVQTFWVHLVIDYVSSHRLGWLLQLVVVVDSNKCENNFHHRKSHHLLGQSVRTCQLGCWGNLNLPYEINIYPLIIATNAFYPGSLRLG